MINYKYIIFGSNNDYYKIAYNDILNHSNITYISNPDENFNIVTKIIHKIHLSKKLNKIIDLPFKDIWSHRYLNDFPISKENICFIFFSNWLNIGENGLIKYIRKNFPNSFLVYFAQDLISLKKNIKIKQIKHDFDLVLTYDINEAQKYDILYHPTVYSYIDIEPDKCIKNTDVYFLGEAKNRYKKIIDTFNYLTLSGISCDFYIAGVPKKEQIHAENIHYIKKMKYIENLMHVKRCKCILEIKQDSSTGFTFRTWEAIMYDKKLITDNTNIKKTDFYDRSYISIFNDINTIDLKFITNNSEKKQNKYKNLLSPINLLEFIENKLTTKKK